VHDLGPDVYFLGYEIDHDREKRNVFVFQRNLASEIVERHCGEVQAVPPRSTPLPDGEARNGLFQGG
jgi:hypothetical protein